MCRIALPPRLWLQGAEWTITGGSGSMKQASIWAALHAHAQVGADHRLGQTCRAGGQQVLGVLVRRGGRFGRTGAVELVQGDVARSRMRPCDHRQARQNVRRQPVAKQGGVFHVDSGRVQHLAGVSEPGEVRAGQAILGRDRRHRHPLTHGGVADQRVIDVVARQDQQRAFAGDTDLPQPRSKGPHPIPGLREAQCAPAVARALGQPEAVWRGCGPMSQGDGGRLVLGRNGVGLLSSTSPPPRSTTSSRRGA